MGKLVEVKQYCAQAAPILEQMAERFYNEPDLEAWGQFTQFIEGVEYIIINNEESIKSLIVQLTDVLPTVLEAMEKKDSVLIGDLLLYEIKPIYESIATIGE